MKNLFCILLLFGFSLNVSSQELYNSEGITLIEITFENSNWDQELDDLYALGNGVLLATVEINGINYDSVGINYRGGASYDPDQGKNPLKIDLDFTLNQDYDGFEVLRLNNGGKDPSFIREVLSFEIANLYMPAPRANYAQVFVNGSYHGLYANVQTLDDNLMGNIFSSDKDNSFFECSPDNVIGPLEPGCTEGNASSLEFLGNDIECYKDYYTRESSNINDWGELLNLTSAINTSSTTIESQLNIDRAIWFCAMNNLLVNLDSYIGVEPDNYFIFQDDNDRFNTVIWDLNESFGGDQDLDAGLELTLTEMQNLDPLLRANDDTRPLIKMILQNPRYKRMYIAHYRTMLNELLVDNWYGTRSQELVDLITDAVEADPNRLYSIAEFFSNQSGTIPIDWNGSNVDIPGIAELMNARMTFLQSHPELVKTPPTISNLGTVPLNIVPNNTITITAEVTGSDFVYLGFRDNVTEVFQKEEMFDDGNHNDGAAGDGIFGADVVVGVQGIQYYIYAEDSGDDVAVFSPERAEHEFHSLSTYGDVVINEFMASNNTTVTDQDGEYEDWVELYNNTSTSINLEGYFLSDNETDLMKYEFPNVTIDGGGFIIIWLDNDPMQQGLHADFKLSGDGEQVVLSNANGQVVDKVVFGSQTSDVSYARIPNGTGQFTFTPPTFNLENVNPNSTIDLAKELGLNIYPNPANDFLVLEMESQDVLQVDMYNVLGQQVKQFVLDGKIELDIADLEQGMYWLSTEGRILGKVVVR